jgi:hypothetical protein
LARQFVIVVASAWSGSIRLRGESSTALFSLAHSTLLDEAAGAS